MVETNTFIERILRCNNCQDQLSFADQEHYGEEVCTICEMGFSDGQAVICIEYESDKEGHAHKGCWEKKLKEERAKTGDGKNE